MKRRNRRIGVIIVAGAVIVLAGLTGLLAPVRWVFDHTVVPVGQSLTASGSSTGTFFGTLGEVDKLSSSNASLEQQNEQLKAQLAALGEVEQENADLRQQMNLSAASGWQTTGSDIVAYQPDSYRQFVTIDRGSKSGIKVGQAATSNGQLVGEISQVSGSTSQVLLISDPKFRLAVLDQDTGATGVLEGQLGSGLIMDDISQTDTIKAGDTIVSDGLGGAMPVGIAIGQVETVNSASDSVFQSAAVTPGSVLSRLRLIFVVTSP